MPKRVRLLDELVEGKAIKLLDQHVKILKVGPEQSLIKWEDGREAFVPNSWIKEEKDHAT